MHHKYLISREDEKNNLNIKEYAIIEKKPKKAVSSIQEKANYALICEEVYSGELIVSSIAQGIRALVTSLRTRNLFPTGPNASQIAQSVIELYESSDGCSVELFFDDLDGISA